MTLVFGKYGLAAVFEVVEETEKAVKVRNDDQPGSCQYGKTCWIPRRALSPNAEYSYGSIRAYTVAEWFIRRTSRYQRIALSLSTY